MRILFVLAYYHPYLGGAERIFKRLAEGLVQLGHHVKVITTQLRDTPRHEQINGVEIERVPTARAGDRYTFSFFGALPAIKAAREYDLIHTTAYNGAPPAFLAARLAGRPIVFTALEVLGHRWHMVETSRSRAFFFRLFEQLVTRLPYDAQVSISQATHTDLIRSGARPVRSSVIHCGVDEDFVPGPRPADQPLRQLCGAEPDDFLYVYFGRPGITKGVEYLLRAAPAIQQQIPRARLAAILSRDPFDQYERLINIAQELRTQARIHFIPPTLNREQMVNYLRDANCVVVPSLTEGFGLSAAEACSAGLPVIATRVGSLPEVVFGKHIFIDPGSAEAISTAVVRAYRNDFDPYIPPRRYCWAAMVEEYEAVYQGLLR